MVRSLTLLTLVTSAERFHNWHEQITNTEISQLYFRVFYYALHIYYIDLIQTFQAL